MSVTEILKRVEHYASSHRLFLSGERYLVALSGGADSVALLCILQAMGVTVEAAHCNFHLRGDESDRDEQFCVKLCNQRDVILHRVHFDTQAYAKLHHISIEMAARRLRYHYFAQLVHDIQAKAVCVAHHRDDSVETLLLNLLRGTGIHGLTGIRPISHQAEQDGVGELDIVRPLLCLSRVDIESYLSSLGQSFVTDSTNLVPDAALRNRIRLQLLPLMNDIVPSATENIHRTTENMQQAVQVFDHAMESSSRECVSLQKDLVSINIETLQNQPSPEYTLFIILRDYGFNTTQISQIYSNLQASSGRRFDSSTHQLVFHCGTLLIAPLPKTQKPLRIPEPGTYVYGQDKRIKVSLQDVLPNDSLNFGNDDQRMTVVYDADEVSFPLIVRPIGQGDRFCPFGMNGTKLVSDYLTDRKRSLIDRQRQLVVTDAEGNILWLVGERRAEGHRVTSETQKILIVEFS